jgi:hypothetical protein
MTIFRFLEEAGDSQSSTPRARLVTVPNDCVARRRPQRIEPGIVMPPPGESLEEERLGTCSELGVSIARWLRWDARQSRSKSSPRCATIRRTLVPRSSARSHPSRQDTIPVTHQLQICPLIPCDILDSVAELVSSCVKLLQAADAAGHRLTPNVDDPRIRQHQVDQANVREIVRHLVRRNAAARADTHPSRPGSAARDVRTGGGGRGRAADPGSGQRRGSLSLQFPDDSRNVVQFLRPIDVWV